MASSKKSCIILITVERFVGYFLIETYRSTHGGIEYFLFKCIRRSTFLRSDCHCYTEFVRHK